MTTLYFKPKEVEEADCNQCQSAFMKHLLSRAASMLQHRIGICKIIREVEKRYGKEWAIRFEECVEAGHEWPVLPSC